MVSLELSRSGLRAFWLYAVYDWDSRKWPSTLRTMGITGREGKNVGGIEGGLLVCGYSEGGEIGWLACYCVSVGEMGGLGIGKGVG
jgi:hypothetical protein